MLCRALREQVPTATFIEPRGGYFVWVELPDDMRAAAMRLSFAHYDAPTLVEGVERLARAMEGYGRAV